MEKLTFFQDSWHYKLVREFTDFHYSEDKNICSYTRAFIAASIKVSILTFVVLSVVSSFICAGLSGLGKLFHWSLPAWVLGFGQVGTILFGLLLGFLGCITFFGLVEYIKEKRSLNPKPPGALKEMYTSWKEKTCKQIEFL